MAFVDAAIAVGSAVGLEGTAAAIGGGALMAGGAGALAGGLYNGLTGRSVLNGALIGGAIGGIGGATAGFGLAPEAVAGADATAVGMGYSSAAEAIAADPANASLLGLPQGTTAAQAASLGGSSSASAGWAGSGAAPGVAGGTPVAAGNVPAYVSSAIQTPDVLPSASYYADGYGPLADTAQVGDPQAVASNVANTSTGGNAGGSRIGGASQLFSGIKNFVDQHPYATAAGVGALAYGLGSRGRSLTQPNYLQPYTPPSAASYGLGRTLASSYRPTFAAAEGGVVPDPQKAQAGLAALAQDLNLNTPTPAVPKVAPKFQMNPSQQEDYIRYSLMGQLMGQGTGMADQYSQQLQQQADAAAAAPVQAPQMVSTFKPTFAAAEGGIAKLADGGLLQTGPAQTNFMGSDMFPQSQIQRSYYATPTQMPTSAQQTMAGYEPKTNPLTGELTANMAGGGITAAGVTGLQSPTQSMDPNYIQSLANEFGTTPQIAQHGLQALQGLGIAKAAGGSVGSKYNLGSYSDGGRLLKGPGDGMSDNIPATIADKQPARLADGEFVVPADVVSHLGNGSTDAGAKHLYKMMDNVRKARTGRKAQGKQIKADKFLPK